MGKNQTVKEFARQFGGLELLTRTNEGITLGDLYNKRRTGKTAWSFRATTSLLRSACHPHWPKHSRKNSAVLNCKQAPLPTSASKTAFRPMPI